MEKKLKFFSLIYVFVLIQICVRAETNSTIFQGSNILTQMQSVSLQKLLNFSNSINYTLIYQASRDGFRISDFFSVCSDIFNTLMIVQTNTSYVLGFFTTKDWAAANQFWQYDKDAFIFSFVNPFRTPVKMNVLAREFALRGNPTELNIGYEILINDEFNRNLNYGWSGQGNSYELPNLVNESAYLLIDSSGFFASEIEVYEVDGCWLSPCLNNGKCHKSSNNKHECTCTNGYFGDDCQSKVLDSIMFPNSTILTQDQGVSFQQLINFASNTKINLIYQASRDGFGLKDFHSKCDGVLNTLMVIKTTDSYVFGGFTTKDWTGLDGYMSDSNAFLFSLINPFDQPVKMNIIDLYYAIYQGPDLVDYDYNDFFGFGQNNILLNDYSNTQISYAWSSSSQTYELPSFVNSTGSLLIGGKSSFFSMEIEVFSLVKKPTSLTVIQNAGQCHALVPCFIQPIVQMIDSDGNLIKNISSLMIQASITFSTNRVIGLMYQSQASVINGSATFTNLTLSNYSNNIVITYSSLQINGTNSFGFVSFNTTGQPIPVTKPSFKCVASTNQTISLSENAFFNLTFLIVDSTTKIPIPTVVWRNFSWQANIKLYSLAFYPPQGFLLKKNTTTNNFDSSFGITYFTDMQLNRTGMYILSVSVLSSEKDFSSQCHSFPIRVVKTVKNTTNKPNFMFTFKASDSSLFTLEEENKMKASIYNCMENYNISVLNLELAGSHDFDSRRRRQSPSPYSAGTIVFKFYSSDTNQKLVINLASLNISDKLVFVSATINGVSYGDDSSSASASSSVVGIIIGCVLGISFLFF